MSVSLSFKGRLDAAVDPDDLLAQVREFSQEMEWGIQSLELRPPRATLGAVILEEPHINGAVLLPHFACEPVPILVAGPDRVLVDSFVRDVGDQGVVLDVEPIVNSHFGGEQVHQEICQFLAMIRERSVSDLCVDDETGFFDTGDEEQLTAGFQAAWAGVSQKVDRIPTGQQFQVAGFEFVPAESRTLKDEFDRISSEDRSLLEGLEAMLSARYGGLGMVLEPSARGIEDLDLLMSESDQEGWGADLEDAETEAFAHGLGALFGRAIIALYGGCWSRDHDEGLVVTDVGGKGLRVNPFQIAAVRLTQSPACGFGQHAQLFGKLLTHVPSA